MAKEGEKASSSANVSTFKRFLESKSGNVKSKPIPKKKVVPDGNNLADLAKHSGNESGKKKVSSTGLDIASLAKQSKSESGKKKVSNGGLDIADLAKNSMKSQKVELGVGSGKFILENKPSKMNTSGSINTGFGGGKSQTGSNLKTSFGGSNIKKKGALKSSFGGGNKSTNKSQVEKVGDINELLESRKSLIKNTLNHDVNQLHKHLKEKLSNSTEVVVDLAELSKIEKQSRDSWYKTTRQMTVEKRASKDSIQRRYNRAVKAREQAEAVIEESARKLYLAQEETKKALESETKAKAEVEAILLDLNKAIAEANNSELRRRALMITGVTGIVLYLFTEFSLEPFVEAAVGNGIELILAKVFLLFILIPFQMIIERFMIKQTHSDGDGVREHMFREILSVVIDDGVVDEKERNLIETFRRHNGLDHTRAEEIMSEYLT